VVGGSLRRFIWSAPAFSRCVAREQNFFWVDAAGMALALGIGYFSLTIGLRVLHSASGTIDARATRTALRLCGP